MTKTVRTRFAPSPTGELHLGNARIAVLNWLYARHCGGRFILRIEDTDIDRNVPEAEEEIEASLRRLGLDWDEGPDLGGPHGPYRQSERSELYRAAAARLLEMRAAFHCYCQPEELEAKRAAARARGEDPRYDGTCRDLSPEQERRLRERGIVPSIRFRVPSESVTVHDEIRGDVTFGADEFSDFVILKSDGLPTYNFAVVVDDSEMEISHVIRGVGHLSNTPRQVLLYRALAAAPPRFVHVPHVLGPDGTPLSKRHGARSLREYLDAGYPPAALINYLSLLSWSSPSGDEVLETDRLVREIDLSRLGVSNVILDPEKLEWLAGEHIRRMSPGALADRLAEFVDPALLPRDAASRIRVAEALRERITTFSGAAELLRQFKPPDPMQWSEAARAALETSGTRRTLEVAAEALASVEPWDGSRAMEAIREAGRAIGVKGRTLFMPIRAAVTGEIGGPDLADIFAIQGRETTLRVVGQAIQSLRDPDDS